MSDESTIHSRENGEQERSYSSGTIYRAGTAYQRIKRGEDPKIKELYPVKEAPVYDIDFSQLNID